MKKASKLKQQKRAFRHRRLRAKVKGTAERPRLAVFKSNACIYAQVINDETGNTLASAQDLKEKELEKMKVSELKGKAAKAYQVGQLIAVRALGKGIEKVVFDRGGNKYYGRVKAVADGARDAGLKF